MRHRTLVGLSIATAIGLVLPPASAVAENFISLWVSVSPGCGTEPDGSGRLDLEATDIPCLDDSTTRTWQTWLGPTMASWTQHTYANSYLTTDIQGSTTATNSQSHVSSLDAWHSTEAGLPTA